LKGVGPQLWPTFPWRPGRPRVRYATTFIHAGAKQGKRLTTERLLLGDGASSPQPQPNLGATVVPLPVSAGSPAPVHR